MHQRVRPGFLALTIFLISVSTLFAQSQTGSILVRVVDPDNQPLPGVKVTIASPALVAGQVAGVTDQTGRYRFPAVPPGVYTVTFELSGFSKLVRENIAVRVGQTTNLDVQLQLVKGKEEITVSGASPVVNVTETKVATNISSSILHNVPGGRDIWSLLEYKAPSLVSSNTDVGGSESGLQAGFVARGTPPSQNTQALNGVNVTDPEAIGFADFYYDYGSFEEVQVVTASHDVEVATPGVYVNMVTKRGGDRLSAWLSAYYQSEETQSDNVTEELRAQGVEKTGFDFLEDFSAQFGGPLLSDRLRFFTSGRIWRIHRFVPGFVDDAGNPVVESTDIPSILFNVTWQVHPKHTIDLFYTRQWYDKPQRGASALNTPLSNWKEDDTFDIYQVAWNATFTDDLFLEARASFVDIFFPLFIKEEAKRLGNQSVTELTTGKVTGANTLELIFNRHRLQSKVVLNYFNDDLFGVRHEFKLGWDFSYNPNSVDVSALDDVNLFTFNGLPAFVILFNTPVNIKRNTQFNALFASDKIFIGRLAIDVGARLENVKGWLPDQSSPAGTFAPARSFSSLDVINWTNISPRFGFSFDLTGDGRTAFKAAVARYYHQISTGIPDEVNPNGLAGEFRIWNDLNGDMKFEPGEEGPLLSTFGGVFTEIDPDIKQPYTDELVLSLEREIVENLRASATLTLRRDRRLLGTENIAAIWNPVQVEDPETGNLITVFDRDPSTLGNDRFLLRNAPELNQNYVGLELVVEKRFSHRWQMLASLTFSKTEQDIAATGFAIFGIGARSVDPNDRVNAKGRPFWDRPVIFKLSGSYILPYNITLAGNIRVQSGKPFNRLLNVPLTQGVVTVFAEPPGTNRHDTIFTLDLRLAKTFRIANQYYLDLMIDGYNLTNENTVLDAIELTGPAFGTPTAILAPRIFRFGARFRF